MTKIVIDRSLCSGFGACVELAPHLFGLDGDGVATLRGSGTSEERTAHDAAASCPMGALAVIDEHAA